MHMVQPFPSNSSRTKSRSTNLISIFATSQIYSGEETTPSNDSYNIVPRSALAEVDDVRITQVERWLNDPKRIEGLTDKEFATFVQYATQFFISRDRLWKKDAQGEHKLVVKRENCLAILREIHDNIGHKRFFTTRSALLQHFWWPHVQDDIVWYVQTCDICQKYQTQKVHIPPVVAMPAPLFSKIYVDTMHLPNSGGFRYLVQGRCSLTQWPEFWKLRRETAATIGEWLYEDIICRWGAL
jgi:hypothetical protein